MDLYVVGTKMIFIKYHISYTEGGLYMITDTHSSTHCHAQKKKKKQTKQAQDSFQTLIIASLLVPSVDDSFVFPEGISGNGKVMKRDGMNDTRR